MVNIRVMFMARKSYGALAYQFLLDIGFDVPYVVCPESYHEAHESLKLYDLAYDNGSKILNVEKINSFYSEYNKSREVPQILDEIDIIVSFHFWERVQHPFLTHPKLGAINFHPAPLPEYRGWRPYTFAIINNEKQWGVTAHYMNEKFDEGDIIQVDKIDVDCSLETGFSLMVKGEKLRLAQFKDVMTRLKQKECLPRLPQKYGSYYNQKMFESGKLISPDTMSEDEIDRRIRAYFYPPREGSYLLDTNGKRHYLINDFILKQVGAIREFADHG